MSFNEQEFASDPTNWWIPNAACCEAMIRSVGFSMTARPGHEIYICTRDQPRTSSPPPETAALLGR